MHSSLLYLVVTIPRLACIFKNPTKSHHLLPRMHDHNDKSYREVEDSYDSSKDDELDSDNAELIKDDLTKTIIFFVHLLLLDVAFIMTSQCKNAASVCTHQCARRRPTQPNQSTSEYCSTSTPTFNKIEFWASEASLRDPSPARHKQDSKNTVQGLNVSHWAFNDSKSAQIIFG